MCGCSLQAAKQGRGSVKHTLRVLREERLGRVAGGEAEDGGREGEIPGISPPRESPRSRVAHSTVVIQPLEAERVCVVVRVCVGICGCVRWRWCMANLRLEDG